MQIQKIINLIDKFEVRLVILLCHHNADPDSIGSAFALKGLIKRIKPKLRIEIGVPGGPSRLSTIIMNHLQIEINENPHFDEVGLFILLDTNTIQQLNNWRSKIKADIPLVLIDHHIPHPETENISDLSIVDEKASSTCAATTSPT